MTPKTVHADQCPRPRYRALCFLTAAVLACPSGTAVATTGYGMGDIRDLDCTEIDRRLGEGVAAGNPEAMHTTARLIYRRACFKRNFDAYASLLQRAAQAGHKPAMWDLGLAHAMAEGVPQDYALAGEWLRKSGSEAAPALNDYTLGYVMAMQRQVARYTGMAVPQWLKYPHLLQITMRVEPVRGLVAGSVRKLGPMPEGAEDEVARLIGNVQADLDDALHKARKTLPPVSAERMTDKPFGTCWLLVASATGVQAQSGYAQIKTFIQQELHGQQALGGRADLPDDKPGAARQAVDRCGTA